MLLYGCFNIDISRPKTQYLKTFPKFSRVAELQPLRASRTLSFPQTRRFGVALMQMRRREASQGGGWGCGPEQLAATVLCALLQWMYHNGKAADRCSGRRQSWATIPFSSMSRFMYFRESKPKFLSPNSFSTMSEVTPTTASLWKYQRWQRTKVLCAITPTAERLSK